MRGAIQIGIGVLAVALALVAPAAYPPPDASKANDGKPGGQAEAASATARARDSSPADQKASTEIPPNAEFADGGVEGTG